MLENAGVTTNDLRRGMHVYVLLLPRDERHYGRERRVDEMRLFGKQIDSYKTGSIVVV